LGGSLGGLLDEPLVFAGANVQRGALAGQHVLRRYRNVSKQRATNGFGHGPAHKMALRG
jgi:hypothetical protein